jgi:hypothetical protein
VPPSRQYLCAHGDRAVELILEPQRAIFAPPAEKGLFEPFPRFERGHEDGMIIAPPF